MGARNHRWPLVLLWLALGQHLVARLPAASAQRSLNHWKRDLEYRLGLDQHQRRAIDDIIGSSILRPSLSATGRALPNPAPPPIVLTGDVRFFDLVVPSKALVLSDHIARPTANVLLERTRHFLGSKLNDLGQIRNQIDLINRQLLGPGGQMYIYKGARNAPIQSHPGFNQSSVKIPGVRVFKQAHFVNLARSPLVQLRRVNNTDVDRVIDETYMRNYQFGLNDAQGRLFFEGRKTFWDTTFQGPLRSGCCDRLRPLHTNRMLLRSAPQDVLAPVLIKSSPSGGGGGAVIFHQLQTNRLLNRHLTTTSSSKPAVDSRQLVSELLASPPENVIQLPGLIQIRVPRKQPEVLKTLVFREPVLIEEGFLSNSALDGRLAIGLSASPVDNGAGPALDLAHDNYLLKFLVGPAPAATPFVQLVRQPVHVNGAAHFLAHLEAHSVNHVENFKQFVEEQLVRLDRPTIVRGPVQFNALPSLLDNHNLAGGAASRQPQSVPVMQVDRQLEVGSLNGMRLPRDIVLLPTAGLPASQNLNQTLRPRDVIHVRGPRLFQAPGVFHEILQVSGLVNGLHFPRDVIPLHLNDFVSSVGRSKLVFVDGITAGHLTTQSGQFADIVLRDVAGDAQSLIMRAAIAQQADGSQLIRAPLRVANLNLLGSGGARGRLNGVRPQEIAELVGGGANGMLGNGAQQQQPLLGRKTFLAPVEASECLFSNLNTIANWTNHLIRIDRPQTVQTIHTKLAFRAAGPPGAVRVDRFDVEFQPDDSAARHQSNWNFSPEFYLMHQALHRAASNSSGGGRFRVLNQLSLFAAGPVAPRADSPLSPPPPPPAPTVNGIPLNEVVTKDRPMQFSERFTMVGKVELASGSSLRANRVQSNYPLDAADLVQFDRYRIPLAGVASPVQLNNLALGADNRASFVQVRQLNGLPFGEFAASVMSLTRPQVIHSELAFAAPVELRGFVRTSSALNGIKNFAHFARTLQQASYSFENGLQCNTLVVS